MCFRTWRSFTAILMRVGVRPLFFLKFIVFVCPISFSTAAYRIMEYLFEVLHRSFSLPYICVSWARILLHCCPRMIFVCLLIAMMKGFHALNFLFEFFQEVAYFCMITLRCHFALSWVLPWWSASSLIHLLRFVLLSHFFSLCPPWLVVWHQLSPNPFFSCGR